MAYVAKRRRGPNKPKPEVQETAAIEAAPPTKRRRRASTGGFHLKLAVPEKKGFRRRWFNDTPGRLANAEELAYEHVVESGIKSDSPDSRVRRLVGTQASGQPLYAYLMETPEAEFQAGIQDKEEAHAAFEASIRRGVDHTGQMRDAYGQGSIEER